MKVTDNGFSERIATTSSRSSQAADVSRNTTTGASSHTQTSSSDTLQLSNIASRLGDTSSLDAGRSARLSTIANAVKSKSFQVDSMQISKALVSEAVGGAAR